jgi:surface antigen
MKTSTKSKFINSFYGLAASVVTISALSTPFAISTQISAESLDDLRQRTEKLEQQIESANNQASKLRQRGNSLKEVIEQLDTQIALANSSIEITNNKILELERELQATQKELDHQKELLKASMRALYKRGDASTVELIVGSDSFSEFMDEQEYLERLKLGIQESTQKIIALKQQIEAQQNEQKELKKQQEAQRELVRKAKAEQAQLLAETQGLESRFRARSAKLQKQQAQLLAEIVSRSRVISGVGTGSYPWSNYRSGSWTHAGSCNYGDDIDEWGYCYRQCVSFAAWRLYSVGKTPPENYGNAENWDDAARADRIPTGSQPKVGAIAVWNGYEGHVAYVEEILGGGQVRISEYNAVPALQGKYSQRIIHSSDPSTYIYFK